MSEGLDRGVLGGDLLRQGAQPVAAVRVQRRPRRSLLSDVLLGIHGPLALLPALLVAALFATHGLSFAALRLRGVLRERAAVLSGGTGEGRTYALTAAALVAIGVLAGFRLPLTPGTSGALLVPVILTMTPFLVASQAWVWWTFRHRVSGPTYL